MPQDLLRTACTVAAKATKKKNVDDHSASELKEVCHRLESSSLSAAGYFQIAMHLSKLAEMATIPWMTSSTTKPTEESVAALSRADESDMHHQQRQRQECLSYLDKALAEPGIPKIQANIHYASIKRQMVNAKKIERTKDGIAVVSMQATNEYGVPAGTRVPTSLEEKEDAVLAEAWKQLCDMGQPESLTALQVARTMKQKHGGSKERQVLAAVFGNRSAPVLACREDEAWEDLRYGGGKRAEELFTELLSENKEPSSGTFRWDQLISAKKKRGKYAEAIEVFTKMEEIEDNGMDPGLDAHRMLQLVDLHSLNGDLETASKTYLEVATMKRKNSWRFYGYIGIGGIELQKGNLEQAQAEFQNAIRIAEKAIEAAFSKNYGDTKRSLNSLEREESAKSNAYAGISNFLIGIGDTCFALGYHKEAVDAYEQSITAVDNKWFRYGGDHKKRVVKLIEKVNSAMMSNVSGQQKE